MGFPLVLITGSGRNPKISPALRGFNYSRFALDTLATPFLFPGSATDLLTWNAFSEQCEAKLVHVVLLLYLAVSSALER